MTSWRIGRARNSQVQRARSSNRMTRPARTTRGDDNVRWTDLLDALYGGSWNPSIGRFRSPFAFRGQPRATDDLSSGLQRLAAGRPDVARLELALLRNFRKYAYGQGATDSVWHWLALG